MSSTSCVKKIDYSLTKCFWTKDISNNFFYPEVNKVQTKIPGSRKKNPQEIQTANFFFSWIIDKSLSPFPVKEQHFHIFFKFLKDVWLYKTFLCPICIASNPCKNVNHAEEIWFKFVKYLFGVQHKNIILFLTFMIF